MGYNIYDELNDLIRAEGTLEEKKEYALKLQIFIQEVINEIEEEENVKY